MVLSLTMLSLNYYRRQNTLVLKKCLNIQPVMIKTKLCKTKKVIAMINTGDNSCLNKYYNEVSNMKFSYTRTYLKQK